MCIIIISFCLLCSNLNTISASTTVESKMIFGGIVLDPNENYNGTMNTEDMPSIAHIFTATWCTPCVEVEHAIENVANDTDVVMLTFHRFAGETEDPFGSENAENWWKEWFQEDLPLQPTAIINGGEPFIGASQGSYDNLYDAAIKKPELNKIATPIISTDFNSNTSMFEWGITAMDECSEGVKTFINFVEESAYFPNGSNGLKNYTHIVHHVIELAGTSGTMDLSQKLNEINSYDGDDLNLIITFSCMKSSEPGPDEGIKPTDEDSSSRLPHIGLIPTIITIVATSMIISRRNSFESIN